MSIIGEATAEELTAARRVQRDALKRAMDSYPEFVEYSEAGTATLVLSCAPKAPDGEADVLCVVTQEAGSEYPNSVWFRYGSHVEYYATTHIFKDGNVTAYGCVGIAPMETCGAEEFSVDAPSTTDFDLGELAGQVRSMQPYCPVA